MTPKGEVKLQYEYEERSNEMNFLPVFGGYLLEIRLAQAKRGSDRRNRLFEFESKHHRKLMITDNRKLIIHRKLIID